MDLNYLYHRRGKSLLMAAQASCERARNAHLDLASGYLARIGELRSAGSGGRMNPPQSREDAADDLREQAASYRRLARRARTGSGWTALVCAADRFDTDATRIDPRGLRR